MVIGDLLIRCQAALPQVRRSSDGEARLEPDDRTRLIDEAECAVIDIALQIKIDWPLSQRITYLRRGEAMQRQQVNVGVIPTGDNDIGHRISYGSESLIHWTMGALHARFIICALGSFSLQSL